MMVRIEIRIEPLRLPAEFHHTGDVDLAEGQQSTAHRIQGYIGKNLAYRFVHLARTGVLIGIDQLPVDRDPLRSDLESPLPAGHPETLELFICGAVLDIQNSFPLRKITGSDYILCRTYSYLSSLYHPEDYFPCKLS